MKKNILFLIFSVTLASTLGLASVTPALPKIANSLNVNADRIGLVFTIFALPSLILTPILGFLADIKGRKKVLIPSLIIFSISGFACFFAQDFTTLLILRFIEGCGASALGAINVTLIGDYFEGNERAKIMGLNNSVLGICTALFPVLGGLLSKIDWNYIFLLPLIAFPIGIFSIFYLKEDIKSNNESIKNYFKNLYSELFKVKILGLFSISAIGFISLFGAFLTYTPFILTSKFQLGTFEIGIIISSMSVFMAFFSSFLGKISANVKKINIILTAFIFYILSMIFIPNTNYIYLFFMPTMFFGLGHGLNIPTIQTILSGSIKSENRAALMSLNRMVAQLGQAIGPLIMGFILYKTNLDFIFYFTAIILSLTLIILYIYSKKRSI